MQDARSKYLHNMNAEQTRLEEDRQRKAYWRRWGPYLSERQWGTVREDYSATGQAWDYFPHDHARSRAYRWGEDGILGISDNHQRLCFALTLWNEKDPILKERIFGLTGDEGNHGEDVKEYYFYLDSTPSHSYLKGLYKYPQAAFPYEDLIRTNAARGKDQLEYELLDTGVFDENRYFDVTVEYAKQGPEDILIRVTAVNRGPDPAPLHLLPTLWFRNTWSYGLPDGHPSISLAETDQAVCLRAEHQTLGETLLFAWKTEALFTDNETNAARLFGAVERRPRSRRTAWGVTCWTANEGAINPDPRRHQGRAALPAGLVAPWRERGRLTSACGCGRPRRSRPTAGTVSGKAISTRSFDVASWGGGRFLRNGLAPGQTFDADEPERCSGRRSRGMLWSKQFYHYNVDRWLKGDDRPTAASPEARAWAGATMIGSISTTTMS